MIGVGVHPVLAGVSRIDAVLDGIADVQPVFMATADKRDALEEMARAEARLGELRLRVLAASDEVGEESGARDAAAWVSVVTRTDHRAALADHHLAKALESRPVLAAGMREGRVSLAQARAVVLGLDQLPADLAPQVVVDAEATLVGHCATFRPAELRRLAQRILDVVAPDIAEAEEGKRLEAEERRAREKASLRFKDLGDGTSRMAGRLPTSVCQRLETYLQAYTSPRQRGGAVEGRRVPQHRAYAEGFASLLELLDPDQLPEHGGDSTTVFITMTLEQLLGDLATAGMIATEEDVISAEQARRLACQASIIPAVLGAAGEVLDLGRTRRLFSRAQRKAIRLRDKRCRAEGCTVPVAWTEAHHLRPWSEGGATDIDNAICLCCHHHHRIHDRAYRYERLATGDVRFHRRT
ncbi:hypothetical protein ASE01_07355 [Nocardioides sp. Root190]|nr:hypothetical protein ASE01_07355 [Nocardioides sp. Root190]